MALLLGSLVFLVLCAGLIGPLERCFPYSSRSSSWTETLLCSGLFLVNMLLMALVGGPILVGLEHWLTIPVSHSLSHFIAAFILSDLMAYGFHRVMHASPFLWRLHRLHHDPQHLTWIMAWRQHPADFVMHGIVVGIPGILLGVDLSGFFALVLIRRMWTSFLHADVDFNLSWLSWLIVTPAFHHLHHRHEPHFRNCNFGGTFPLWDIMFGTSAAWSHCDHESKLSMGATNNPPKTAVDYLTGAGPKGRYWAG